MKSRLSDGHNVSNIQEQSTTSETTIPQHHVTVDGDNVNERTPLLINGTTSPSDHAQSEQQNVYRNLACIHILFLAALSTFLIIGVAVATYLLISEGTDWITWSTYSLVRRSDWNAENSMNKLVPYDKEISEIVLMSTKTAACWTEEQCCDIIKNLQKFQIHSLKQPDIVYNFLIGNEGQIYEGTGWKTKLQPASVHQNNSIIIALIGDSNESILDLQTDTAKTFLDVSINSKLLNKCITILVPYDYKATNYFLINFASILQKYVNRYCSEKLLLS